MAFNPIDVEMVKDSADIISTIQKYVELKRSGSSWKGLCPFHREKTPSFFVFPARGTWKCFGCGEGGDVISFLMKHRNLNFLEVVEELAEENGITLERAGSTPVTARTSTGLFEVVAEAQEFYRNCFREPAGKKAREYLRQRSIDEDVLEIGIGYAPGGNSLLAHLRSHDFSISVMNEAGLVITDRGDPYDRFRERLTFPIRDRRGRVVSFGARGFGDAVPKYLNGPETFIYRKGSFLYGYSTAQKSARDMGMVILVEGYFDHARLVSIGFAGTVATCGTALTEKQARNLKGMSDNIHICYDGDSAGSKAAVKAAETLLAQGAYPLIARFPEGMDPDDFVREKGKEAFEQLLGSSLDPVSFCISLLGGKIPDGPGRIRVANRLLEVVASSSNPLVEEDLQRKVEKFTGYSRTALAKSGNATKDSKKPFEYRARRSNGETGSGDRGILRATTAGRLLHRELIRFIRAEDMTSARAVAILTALREKVDQGYSTLVFGELNEDIAGDCADIVGVLESVTSREIRILKMSIERKRREIPRRRELRRGLSDADPEKKAMTLEELADGGSIHER